MQLTFAHDDCAPQDSLGEGTGCPIVGREIYYTDPVSTNRLSLNEYSVPEMRCLHTNTKLKLVAVDGDRNI